MATGGITGFNEAEAFTPRIRFEAKRKSKEKDGFNEAEAFTPRIQYIYKGIRGGKGVLQ